MAPRRRGRLSPRPRLAFESLEDRLALSITALASFDATDGNTPINIDSNEPKGALAVDSGGTLFGDLPQGGAHQDGSIFELANGSNAITTLVSFDGADGGASGNGTIFELSPTPPVHAVAAGALAAIEGLTDSSALATFSDPNGAGPLGGYSATIDWGDGTSAATGTIDGPDASGVFTVTGRHAYAEETTSAQKVSVAVHRSGSLDATVSDPVNVADAPLSESGVGFASGENLNGPIAAFSDLDTADGAGDYSATIDWGDGQTTAGTIAAGAAAGQFTVDGQHSYQGIDNHTLTITVSHGAAQPFVIHSYQLANPNGLPGYKFTVAAATTTSISAAQGLLSQDGDRGLSIAAVTIAGQKGGVFTFHSDGSFTFTPGPNFVTDGVHYQATDGEEGFVSVISPSEAAREKYIAAVYQDVLGRAPDAQGLAYWAGKLDSGAPASSVAAKIGTSDEYYQNFIIKPDYLKIVGRAADVKGLAYWTTKMDAGASDQQVAADLAASDEVFGNAGGTNLDWVEHVYQFLLSRAADAQGEKYWLGRLAAGDTRAVVAHGIDGSQENNTQLINDDYLHYLGRDADAKGLAYWLGQFADGKTNEDAIAGFTGADEYYKKHTS